MRDLETIVRSNASFVIFAAQPYEPHTVMSFLVENSIPFKTMLGSYKNERETSYTVPAEHFAAITQAGLVDEQESFIVLGHIGESGFRKAEIVFSNPETAPVEVGYMVNVSREEALSAEAWTYDPQGNAFFVIRSAEQLVAQGIGVE